MASLPTETQFIPYSNVGHLPQEEIPEISVRDFEKFLTKVEESNEKKHKEKLKESYKEKQKRETQDQDI